GSNAGLGNYADGGWFTDNYVVGLQSQNLAIITAQNIHVNRNTFKDPGRAPFLISGVSNTSPITITTSINNNVTTGVNVTVGGVFEKLRNIEITDNTFALMFPVTTTFSAISYNPTSPGLPNEGCNISGNVVLGRAASGVLNTISNASNASPIVITTNGGHEHP